MNTSLLSRRKFLLTSLSGAGALAACALDARPSRAWDNAFAKGVRPAAPDSAHAASTCGAPSAARAAQDAHFLSEATFTPHVGTIFHLKAEGSSAAPVELAEVQPHASISAGTGFSLLFRAQPRASLPQETYTLAHPELGRFALLLVPIGHAEPMLEAVINRL